MSVYFESGGLPVNASSISDQWIVLPGQALLFHLKWGSRIYLEDQVKCFWQCPPNCVYNNVFSSVSSRVGWRWLSACLASVRSCVQFPELTSLQCHVIKNNLIAHWLQLVLLICFWMWSHALECDRPTWNHTLQENWLSPQEASTIHEPPSFSRLGCWLARSCAGLLQPTTAAVRSWVQWSCHVPKTPPHSGSSSLWCFQSFCPIFCDEAWALGRGCDVDVPFEVIRSTGTSSHNEMNF